MKKINLLLALAGVLTLGGVTSCNGSSSSSISQNTVIDKVEINGSKTVYVGKTITLVAGVSGDPTNSVTWESLNESIATVTSEGVVTGVSEGTVQIKATSTVDTSKFATWELTVKNETTKPTSMVVSIKENEHVKYDSATGIYKVDINTKFQIDYKLNVENPVEPMSISYQIATDSQSGIYYDQYLSVDRATGECEALRAFSEEANETHMVVQVIYVLSISEKIVGNIKIDVVDANVDVLKNLKEKLNKSVEKEKTDLTSAKVVRQAAVGTSKIDKEIDYSFFKNATYAKVLDKTNSSTSYFFNGVRDNMYYNLRYINDLEVYSKGDSSNFKGLHLLAYNYDNSSYGLIDNIITNIISGTQYLNLDTIYSEDSVRYIEISEAANKAMITSTYPSTYYDGENEVASEVAISLELVFDENELLTNYNYSSYLYVDGGVKSKVVERGEMTYQGKPELDTSYEKYADLNKYYIAQDFELSNLEGQTGDGYNFVNPSNEEKYLSASYVPTQEVIDGQTVDVYTMQPNQTFAFEIDKSTCGSSEVSMEFETITSNFTPLTYEVINGEYEGSPLPVGILSDLNHGVFTISNSFTATGKSVKGESLLTLTSVHGYSKTIKIVFTDFEEPSQIFIDAPTVNVDEYGRYHFDDILLGDFSSTFYINTKPDTLEFDFDVVCYDAETNEKVEDALIVYEHESGNPDQLVGYSIKGLKEGSYKFNIFIKGYEDVKTVDMFIKVLPQLDDAEVLENISKRTYDYPGLTSPTKVTFAFLKDKTLKITQEISNVTYEDTIPYDIKNGDIYLSGGVEGVFDRPEEGITFPGTYIELGKNIASGTPTGTEKPYLRYIRTDVKMNVSTDYKTIRAYASAYYDAYTNIVDLKQTVENPLIEYSFKAQLQDQATYAWNYIIIKFNENGTGQAFYQSLTGEIYSVSTFEYTVSESYGVLDITITNYVAGSGEKYLLFKDVVFEFNPSSKTFRVNGSITDNLGNNKLSGFTVEY